MELSDVAQLNAFLLLDAIRHKGTVTRSELARQLKLSPASVSRIVRSLIADGSVEELPGDNGDPGRTPARLRFVPRVGSVVAIDLGGTKCHGVLADLGGEILLEDYRPVRDRACATATVLDCFDALRQRAIDMGAPVRALVIGIPALIDPETGLATAGPNVGWEGFDLLGSLQSHVAEPIEVDNDVNLAAMGQAWRGEAAATRCFVTLSLGTGIGGGVVVDGHLVRGLHNAAGEVGYLVVDQARPGAQRPTASDAGLALASGFMGFEQVASGPALKARAEELLRRAASTDRLEDPGEADDSPSAMNSVLAGSHFDTEDVFKAALDDDAIASQVIAEFVDHVAAAIVSITALLDPELVILDGSVGRAAEPWLPALAEKVTAHVFKPPRIVVSKLGPNATLVGAIARGLALASQAANPAMANLAKSMSRPGAARRGISGSPESDGGSGAGRHVTGRS